MNKRAAPSDLKARAIAAGIASGMVSAMAILTLSQGKAEARRIVLMETSPEVARIVKSADSNAPRAQREMAMLYWHNGLSAPSDYTAAAGLLARSPAKKDLLLAHDLALAGLALGDAAARPIVARTEDRLFAANGLGERFGTLGGKELPLNERHRKLFAGPYR